jgi:hypothetical protein
MDKIASSRELQGELQRILRLAGEPHPSRVLLADELHALADRLGKLTDVKWTEKGGKWLSRAEYAGGEKHEWQISESGDKFSVSVKTPKGTHKAKKSFESLEQAQRFAARFIDKANGNKMLEEALGKDFG